MISDLKSIKPGKVEPFAIILLLDIHDLLNEVMNDELCFPG